MSATHTIAPIRLALKTLVAGVTGIGNVYDYQRHIETEAELKSLYVPGSRLHFWCVTLGPDDKFMETRHPGNHSKAWATFTIRGYYALKDADATEKTFVDLVEDVLDALRLEANKTLGGTCIAQGNPRWSGPSHVSIADVLCHHAEITVPVFMALEG